MDNKPLFVASYFGAAISALIFAIFFLIYLSQPKIIQFSTQNFKLYAALPEDLALQTQNITPQDGRAKIVEDFFKQRNAPLSDHAPAFVSVADKYSLDWRLLPAIAMQESNGGRKIINDSYNPFGYGIYGRSVVKFGSWEEAVERVGRALKEDYFNEGLTTPQTIMAKYTPPSLETGGAWAKGVYTFMEELR